MSGSSTVNLVRLKIRVSKTELGSAWDNKLVEARIQRSLRAVGRATLKFREEDLETNSDFDTRFRFGSEVSIAARHSDTRGSSEIFAGIVVGHQLDIDSRGRMLTVTIHDAATKLAADGRVMTMMQASNRDILGKIAYEHGLKLAFSEPSQPQMWSFHARSALGIVEEIAEKSGYDWIVADSTLAVWSASSGKAPHASDTTVVFGEELHELHVNDSTLKVRDVVVQSWDHRNARELRAEVSAKPQRASAEFLAKLPRKANNSVPIGNAPVNTQAEAEEFARAIAATGGRVLARGKSKLLAELVPGSNIVINSAGSVSGEYYVRDVDHRFDKYGAVTRFVAGDRDAPYVTDPWQTSLVHHSVTHFGRLTIGIVTEIGTGTGEKPAGFVKVQFSAIDGQVASHWAPVIQHGAGNGRGLTLLPEVNDQVIVGFVDGDVRRPLVIGSVYSERDKPGRYGEFVTEAGAVQGHSFINRNGDTFEIIAGDKPESHHIAFALAGGAHQVVLGEKRAEIVVPKGVPLQVKSGDTAITFDGNGKVELEATDVVIKAKNSVEISGQTVAISGTTSTEIESKSQTKIKGGMTNIESSGPTTIKGAVVNLN